MFLKLASKNFNFRSAEAILIPMNWDDESNVSRLQEQIVPIEVTDNRMRLAAIHTPGAYHLWLSKVVLERTHDHSTFVVSVFILPSPITIGESDPIEGVITIETEPDGVYKVTAIDPRARPIAHKRLNMYGDQLSVILDCGEDGSAVFLGNPTAYQIELDKEIGIEIVPL